MQGNSNHPYHVSVGALVYNDKKEILCHYFDQNPKVGYFQENNLRNFYILMRETMEPNESLESTLSRGLLEEFGVMGEIITYIGSIQSHFTHKAVSVEKTTLYFLVKLISIDESKREKKEEGTSTLEWQRADYLIPKMKEQTVRFSRTDLDESAIIERAQKFI